jgi:hypothetical protein
MKHCAIPDCGRLTEAAKGNGLALFHCRYHVQFKARHGSHWHGTYRADEVRPYIWSADEWRHENREMGAVRAARWEIEHRLNRAGRVDPAMNLRGRSAEYRANMAFARLRAADVESERILAIYLGVAALIQDDWKSHNVREFRLVQAAKAMHRLASGTHRKWDQWNPRTGGTMPYEMHVYPRSSGLVLRKIGELVEKACGDLAAQAVQEIIAAKTTRFGQHPSHQIPSQR